MNQPYFNLRPVSTQRLAVPVHFIGKRILPFSCTNRAGAQRLDCHQFIHTVNLCGLTTGNNCREPCCLYTISCKKKKKAGVCSLIIDFSGTLVVTSWGRSDLCLSANECLSWSFRPGLCFLSSTFSSLRLLSLYLISILI